MLQAVHYTLVSIFMTLNATIIKRFLFSQKIKGVFIHRDLEQPKDPCSKVWKRALSGEPSTSSISSLSVDILLISLAMIMTRRLIKGDIHTINMFFSIFENAASAARYSCLHPMIWNVTCYLDQSNDILYNSLNCYYAGTISFLISLFES